MGVKLCRRVEWNLLLKLIDIQFVDIFLTLQNIMFLINKQEKLNDNNCDLKVERIREDKKQKNFNKFNLFSNRFVSVKYTFTSLIICTILFIFDAWI